MLKVVETFEEGVVPEIVLAHSAEQPVLIFDGEELVGARQNRIVNLTILVPAKTALRIPLSCVEAGRWSFRSRTCRPAPHFAVRLGPRRRCQAAHLGNAPHRSPTLRPGCGLG